MVPKDNVMQININSENVLNSRLGLLHG